MRTRRLIVAMAVGIVCLPVTNEAIADETNQEILEKLKERVTLSGAIEVEASWSEDFEGVSDSDIALATAEIGLEARIVEWATGTLALEWDDEENEITVDEAFITLGDTEKIPLLIKAGRFYIPFGVFESNAITDPLTKEAFETREDALMIGYKLGALEAGAYVFNGDTNEGGGDDVIEHCGAQMNYSFENDAISINTHLGYLSSIMDSDTLGEVADLEADYVAGVVAQASVTIVGIGLSGEYITAIDDFEPADHPKSKPASYHVEAGYSFEFGLPLNLGLSYSETKDVGGILPENRIAAFFGVEIAEGLSATVEYCHDIDYEEIDGGTGGDADTVTLQLAYEF